MKWRVPRLVIIFVLSLIFERFYHVSVSGNRTNTRQLEVNSTQQQQHKSADQQHLLPQNRSLVVIMGSLRGGETAWETLYRNVLDVNDADLALIGIGDPIPTAYQNTTILARAKYFWNIPEYGNWADAVDLVQGKGWRETHLPLFHNTTKVWWYERFEWSAISRKCHHRFYDTMVFITTVSRGFYT